MRNNEICAAQVKSRWRQWNLEIWLKHMKFEFHLLCKGDNAEMRPLKRKWVHKVYCFLLGSKVIIVGLVFEIDFLRLKNGVSKVNTKERRKYCWSHKTFCHYKCIANGGESPACSFLVNIWADILWFDTDEARPKKSH